MKIKANTYMLLFRFSDYRKYNFIEEHKKILNIHDRVWMLKIGRKAVASKIKRVSNEGGFIVLKAPKKDGEKYYCAHFTAVEDKPVLEDQTYPQYYNCCDDQGLRILDRDGQWFLLDAIDTLDRSQVESLRLESNGKRAVDVINETRTATMFVINEHEWG